MSYYIASGMALGPAIGYVVGGVVLTFWVDGNENIPAEISPELWVGNWWLVFMITGALAIITGVLVTGLPREIAKAGLNQRRRKRTQQRGITVTSGELHLAHKTTFGLLKNRPFMFIVFAMACNESYLAILASYMQIYVVEIFGTFRSIIDIWEN